MRSCRSFGRRQRFKTISDFSTLTRLTGLRHLAVNGRLWSRQANTNVAPFAELIWLQSLAIDTHSLTSLKTLALLTGLR